MTREEIIRKLKAEIAAQGLSRYEVAKRSGLRTSTLQNFDSTTWGTQIETLVKIAEAIGLEVTIISKKS